MQIGAGVPRVNAGTMSNKGYEFTINYKNSSEYRYSVGANISFIKNNITSLGGGAPQDGGGVGKIVNTTRTEVGIPFPYFFGLKT